MHHQTGKVTRKHDERGASLVEYAMLLALIAVVVFGATAYFGGATKGGFERSRDCLAAAHDGLALPANCQ